MDVIGHLTEELKKNIYAKEEADLSAMSRGSSTISTPDHFIQEPDTILTDLSYNYTLSSPIENILINRNRLIRMWRDVTFYPEVDEAINEIVDEALVFEETGEPPVEIDLEGLIITDPLKEKIRKSFDKILRLLEFDTKGGELFQQWYVDGTLNIEAVYNNSNIKEGIKKLVLLPPFDFYKVKMIDTQQEMFFFTPRLNEYYNRSLTLPSLHELSKNANIKYRPEQITQIMSGVYSVDKLFSISHLNKAMKVINQVSLIEDAIVIVRITRAPEKKVFYIDTGRLPKAKAESYIQQLMNKHRNKMTYNFDTGTVDNRKKSVSILEDYWLPRCLSLDTKISLLDGRDIELSKVIDEYNAGKELWSYSVSPEGIVVPGKIDWAGITRKDTQVVKVTLDNGESVTCTPDHKFVMRDGSEVEAQNLVENDSLMPFYTKTKNVSPNLKKADYHQYKDNKTGKYKFTHRMVSEYFNGKQDKTEVVHHKDMNRFNNEPNNLMLMEKKEHFAYHSKMGTNSWNNGNREEHCKNLSTAGKVFFQTEDGMKRREEISENNKTNTAIIEGFEKGRLRVLENRKKLKETHPETYKEICKERYGRPQKTIRCTPFVFNLIELLIKKHYKRDIRRKEIVDLLSSSNDFMSCFQLENSNGEFGNKTLTKVMKLNGYNTLTDYLTTKYDDYKYRNQFNNHKVVSVEWLEEKIDTGTLTIDQNHIHHDYHNFALSVGIFIKNSADGKGTSIETIGGSSDGMLDKIEDLEWFYHKLYRALNVPANRREKESPFTAVTANNLDVEREEIKFFKFVVKLRKRFNLLFLDLLKKDLLATKTFSLTDWNNAIPQIKFKYKNNNDYAEAKKLANIATKFDIAGNAMNLVESKLISKEWVAKNILGFTDEDMSKIAAEIEASAASTPTDESNF